MDYLKVWTRFEKALEPLQDDEIGRLFMAMLHYAGTGEEPREMTGNERFLWPVARMNIDNTAQKAATNSRNGSKGGRPETRRTEPTESEQKRPKANESESKRTEATESLKEKKIKEKKEKENKISLSFIDDEDAHGIQAEQNRVLDAAEDAGFSRSNSVQAGLLKLYQVHGLEKMLSAFDACVKHNAPSLAYLEAVLKGEPKKAKPKVNAQEYAQRDYADVSARIEDEQRRRIAERMRERGAS